jgi:hypothetical protein
VVGEFVGAQRSADAIAAASASGEPVVVDAPTSEHRLVTADPASGQLVAEFWVEPDGRPQAALTVGRGGDTTVNRFRYGIGSGTPTTPQSMSSSTGTVAFAPPYRLTTVSARLVDRAGNEGPIATATVRVMSPRAQHAWVIDDEGTGATASAATDPDAGQLVAEVKVLPVRVRYASGSGRVDINPTLRRDGGLVHPTATSAGLAFSGGGGSAPLARMAKDGHWMALSWRGALPEPVLDVAVATYPGAVVHGIDLVVQAAAVGFSHYLAVNDARSATEPALRRISLEPATSGLVANAGERGATNLRDSDRDLAFVNPPARMWDSAGAVSGLGGTRAVTPDQLAQPELARSATVWVEVTASEVVALPDLDMLRYPGTVFPVIDPSHSDGRSYWRMVWSNGISFSNSSTGQPRVGYDGWSGEDKTWRAFYRFDTSVIRDRETVSARFEHKQVRPPKWDCLPTVSGPVGEFARSDAIESSTTWDGPTVYTPVSTTRAVNGHGDVCGGWTRTTRSVTDAVRDRASAGRSTLTIRLRSTDESNRDRWRRFSNIDGFPKLIATYNFPPSTPTSQHTTSPSTSWASRTDRPWMSDKSPKPRATLQRAEPMGPVPVPAQAVCQDQVTRGRRG